MIRTKKKVCAGFDGKSHPAFIYKNILGKKYCKFCAFKVENSTEEALELKEENKIKIEARKQFFLSIWNNLKVKTCWSCNAPLGSEPKAIFFDHLIEKSKHKNLDLEVENIFICCPDCHTNRTMGNPSKIHKEAIEKAKQKFL